MEPVCGTYYVADGTMKSVAHLLADSICSFGPVPNFLNECVYDFTIGGPNQAHKKLTGKLLTNILGEIYEKVYTFCFVFFLVFLLRNVEKLQHSFNIVVLIL